jgi:3-deoxy-7-phosphoheptulonate synthase/chorismate mutase
MTTLDEYRAQVAEVDRRILRLLETRTELAARIRQVKFDLGLPLYAADRKAEHIAELVDASDPPLSRRAVERVFGAIHDETLGMMQSGFRDEPVLADLERVVRVGDEIFGGPNKFWIAGPCAVESLGQISSTARELSRIGVRVLRGGAFKPRTRPSSFQGLGLEGLRMLRGVADAHGMAVVTEAPDVESVAAVAEYADMIQVGARNGQNFSLLRAVGTAGRPVLLKRGWGMTISEWLAAAEYVAAGGCREVVLCERGIRTFEPSTRATLDLAAVQVVAQSAGLPVVVDVSHAAGRRDLVVPLARAAFAVGADAVMVEVHPNPGSALSDAAQQLSFDEFARAVDGLGAHPRIET